MTSLVLVEQDVFLVDLSNVKVRACKAEHACPLQSAWAYGACKGHWDISMPFARHHACAPFSLRVHSTAHTFC
jgi:hypothetical protein